MSEREWWRGAALYQIYPASFYDSNGDGWGDLAGIARKLDYVQRLGVDGFWLQSILPSPMADHGYDVTEYRDVNPLFGSLDEFDGLLRAVHARGLRLVLDQVYGHTSNRHPWFVASRRDRDGPCGNWYVWADPKADGTEPNNWRAVTCGPAWTWDPLRAQYFMHHWLPCMPHLNHHEPAVRAEILDVARFWLARGVDGLRLDVLNSLVVDAQLRDNPAVEGPFANPLWAQRMVYDASRPECLDFVRELRRVADSFGDRLLLGEMYGERTLQDGMEYCGAPDLLHTAYHIFGDAQGVAPDETLAARLRAEVEAWDRETSWPTWTFGTHDSPRARTRFGGEQAPLGLAKTLMAFLACLRGTIMIPQGEELGLPLAEVPYHRRRDPMALADYPAGYDRDRTRTPIPWEYGAPHAGFSRGEPWLPVDPRHEQLAVNAQEVDPHSMLRWTRAWLARRRTHRVLREGTLEFLPTVPAAVAFERRHGAETAWCAFNFSAGPVEVRLPGAGVLVEHSPGAVVESATLRLPPWGSALLCQ